jgi:hypothetical protein
MNEDDLKVFRNLSFMKSRIPALDALTTFVPDGQEDDPVIEQAIDHSGSARWYPVEGGHRLLILHQRGEYDTERFKLEKGVWDHEHCKACGDRIDSMTLCWVTESGPYVLICNACHEKLD